MADTKMMRYVYVINQYGLYRFKIPQHSDSVDDHQAFESHPEYGLELVCGMTSKLPQLCSVGMISNGECKVYLVGGTWFTAPLEYNTNKMHTFDPYNYPSEQVFPLDTLPPSDPCGKKHYHPIAEPLLFRPNNSNIIYLFSFFQHFSPVDPIFSFQSFDLNRTSFHTLHTPSFPLSSPHTFFATHFVVSDYIYLFARQSADLRLNRRKPNWVHSAFSFNTKTPPSQTKWKRLDSLSSQLVNQNIPIPYEHTGDTGLSSMFPDNIRILIAIYDYKPTAYRVSVDETGDSLLPISHRPLIDHTSSLFNEREHSRMCDKSHLVDLGDERFCVIYSTYCAPLVVYIFKMDFCVEYENWGASHPPKQSVTILCSKEIKHNDIDTFGTHSLSSACLAFVPASRSRLPSHANMPSELPDKPVQREPRFVYSVDYELEDEYAESPESD